MFESFALGVALGLSSGLAPGPLLALVVSQTVRHGVGHGVRVALAPLVTDLPIVLGTTLLIGSLARYELVVGLISIAGAVVVASIARGIWGATAPTTSNVGDGPNSWRQGIVVNLLSPHPYVFWLTVGAPTLVAAARGGIAPPLGFLAGFYACLVGSKVATAWAISRTGLRAGSRRYRLVMRLLAVVLAVFALVLLVEGLGRLGIVVPGFAGFPGTGRSTDLSTAVAAR